MGDRLLPCVRIHLQDVGRVVSRRSESPGLGAEDVPVAEDETPRDLPGAALGGGDPASADRGGREATAVPRGLQLLAEADAVSRLCPLPSGPSANWQRGDGSGVQDGIHPAAETVRDELET